MAKLSLTYRGKIQPKSDLYYEPIQQKIYPYDAGDELIEVVNLAIELGMPLLLEGEPGCGKSRLAHALVYEFNYHRENNPIKYYEWIVQSTSKAEDSLYQYDYIGRLQAAQIRGILSQKEIEESSSEQKNPATSKQKNPATSKDWVDLQALGKAFEQSKDKQEQSVVLIDEIDKADRDFPNDLLLAIESRRFFIKETGELIQANDQAFPLIIITSNQEKNLPNAFLRRCIYHYIELPNQERLRKILTERFTDAEQEVIIKAVDRFLEVRTSQDETKSEGEKKVSTSELIAWFKSLLKYKPEEIIAKLKEDKLPHASVLLKSRTDVQDYGTRG
ncbi:MULTISPECIES: MoxR family ATPase [unclassified Microcystis]|jgi:MoxR-like ATPase|uniref:MoxR family ATPase n=1 Tax=Microcystis flos-aquae Mf_QC_C_20070823_S10D TaxID=2486236 RepID=A0A552KHH7_9CHRO|nr:MULTISPECIES: MoxR family ATPase [unclassified Microcystis]MCA2818243.1 MoxR family ATPase [Microcystis sp. M085S1]MCA2855108.1 MoxR family ATPase [Microcystis sp. M065S1]TRT75455.1 MAG: MoxR family ATPase [Microcystis flos-aquae Ma_QC_C_20070823_S18]TRU00352.1 MAG: MoxR family ATPase [Microcystis flos-aquae Ma_QC_C_20070823_S18D]TRV07441.1 MAG: MoxR family ATPase [Microcystis flos-aquae Mf_QC_C_20070823_S10D]TRV25564.1 MAG: MoxR family ATPase [Microcystis flos-aquae Mf_QC_C_20070823_S10]